MLHEAVANALSNRRSSWVIADDEDVALVIRYIGDEDSGTVTVAAGGDLTFKHGDANSEAVDATIQLPTGTAGSGGVIDVSDNSANTLGEVADHINASANWECFIVDGLRTESSNDTFLAAAAASASGDDGLTVYWDTSVRLSLAKRLTLQDIDHLGEDYSAFAKVYGITEVSTYTGSGSSSTIQIYEIVTDQYGVVQSETLVHSEAGGASATAKTVSWTGGLKGARDVGFSLLVKLTNAVAMTSPQLQIDGSVVNALTCY